MKREMIEIKTRGIHDVLSISRFSMISTPAGMKNIAMYLEKNDALVDRCSSLMTPKPINSSNRNIAIKVPGNVNGSIDDIASPMRVKTKSSDNSIRTFMENKNRIWLYLCH